MADQQNQPPRIEPLPTREEPALTDPPPNPFGGKTLFVDASDSSAYPRPSAALKEAGPEDQVFIRPGVYEDKIFMVERPIFLANVRTVHLRLQRIPSTCCSASMASFFDNRFD